MISASDWILKANLSTSTVDQYTKVLFSSTRNTSSCDSLGDGCDTLVEKILILPVMTLLILKLLQRH